MGKLADSRTIWALAGRPLAADNLKISVRGQLPVTGESYGDYLAAQVFGPLRMTHSYSTIERARRDGLAEGFSTLFSTYRQRPAATPEALQPSATTFSSAEDLAHEIEMYLAGGSYHGTPVISPATEKTLHAPGPMFGPWSYSMGWWQRPQ